MTFIPMTAATTASVAAAAARQRQIAEEEEKLTEYRGEDLEGWEFKIVRASTRRFRTAEAVRELCEEEAAAGWEMVEKFDDYRVRFKRRVERRAEDPHRTLNPYRTQVGASESAYGLMIVGIFLGGLAVLALGLYFAYTLWGG